MRARFRKCPIHRSLLAPLAHRAIIITIIIEVSKMAVLS